MEDGEDLETALARELREEIAANAGIHSLLHILDQGGGRQYVYLARVHAWSARASDRRGPEFTDSCRGEYHPQLLPLTAEAVEGIDLKPDALARFLLSQLREGTDLFALPDLRASQPPGQRAPARFRARRDYPPVPGRPARD